ncbi:MAG: hypothetical protein QME25_00385 [Bacteroidota bacterium]|nr:hypothetical protein [Bacteroidota bacterium]
MYIKSLNRLLILTILTFSFNFLSFSQITVTVNTANVQQLNPAQLDFQNFQNSIWLFTIDISYPGDHTVQLAKCQVTVDLSDGTQVQLSEGDFNSEPFPITDHKSITNFNFGKDGEIKIRNFTLSSEGRTKIIEPALASGRFPSGTYNFHITVEDFVDPQIYANQIVRLHIEDFSQIELRYPQVGATTNEFPLFEWVYDGREVEVTINEKLPGLSIEESISRFPVTYQNTFTGGQNSFQYPSTGFRPLEKGKSYVWKVTGKIQSPGGRLIQSSIGYFTIAPDVTPIKYSDLIDQLEIILGNKGKNVMTKIRSEKLEPTELYYLNGGLISEIELKELFKFLQDNPDNIDNVTIE